jgi:hypothetical protein
LTGPVNHSPGSQHRREGNELPRRVGGGVWRNGRLHGGLRKTPLSPNGGQDGDGERCLIVPAPCGGHKRGVCRRGRPTGGRRAVATMRGTRPGNRPVSNRSDLGEERDVARPDDPIRLCLRWLGVSPHRNGDVDETPQLCPVEFVCDGVHPHARLELAPSLWRFWSGATFAMEHGMKRRSWERPTPPWQRRGPRTIGRGGLGHVRPHRHDSASNVLDPWGCCRFVR